MSSSAATVKQPLERDSRGRARNGSNTPMDRSIVRGEEASIEKISRNTTKRLSDGRQTGKYPSARDFKVMEGRRVERNRARDRLVSIVRLPVPFRYFLLANVVNSMEMRSRKNLDSFKPLLCILHSTD